MRCSSILVDNRITEQAQSKNVDGQVSNLARAAQERLAEQERILSGRPLPGSRCPSREKERGNGAPDWRGFTPSASPRLCLVRRPSSCLPCWDGDLL